MLEGHFKFPTTTGPSHSNSPKFVHTSCNTTWDSLQVPRLGGFARRQKREGCHVRGAPSPCDPKCLSPVGPHSRNFMNINLIVTRYDAGPQTRLICRLRCLRGGLLAYTATVRQITSQFSTLGSCGGESATIQNAQLET